MEERPEEIRRPQRLPRGAILVHKSCVAFPDSQTNLMAPEAYALKAALDGRVAGESDEQIRRVAEAYSKFQEMQSARSQAPSRLGIQY